ncbi:MAG: hypothetical protein EOO28_16805 [Comamonadaceae bacterium]|nr:MAG: hypothetical protein EOO28_16805 [Comamonadaceae bacterium]
MTTHTLAGPLSAPRWSTSSFSDAATPSPNELASLGEHFSSCNASNGRLLALQHGARAVHGFAASRFVTTLVLASLLIGLSVLVL